MSRGPKLEELALTMQENKQLIEWTRRGSTAQALALRARIVLAAAQGLPSREVARRTRVTAQTVGKWRNRFMERRVDELLGEPRPGAPRKIGDAKVEALNAKTLHEKPRNATHWNSRAMAKGDRRIANLGGACMARVRASAAPARDVQALGRSAVHRQGARHRGALPRSADEGLGAVRG